MLMLLLISAQTVQCKRAERADLKIQKSKRADLKIRLFVSQLSSLDSK